LRCLLHLVRRSAAARIMLVLTDDLDERAAHAEFRAELLRQPHAERVALAPLSEAGVAAVAGTGHATAFHRATGGNPALLRGLLDDHRDTGDATVTGYGRALLRCVHGAGAAAVAVLRALAVLDDGAGADEVAQLVELPDAVVDAALGTMTAAGVLNDGRFRHPVGRAAVLADLPDTVRDRLHRCAAELLHAAGAPAVRVARHLVHTGHRPSWARATVLEAAEQALLSSRPDFAVECLEAALRCTPDDGSRPDVLARLAHAEWSRNPATAARHLTSLAESAQAGLLARPQRLALVRQLLWHGRTEEATALLRAVRATQQAQPDEQGASEVRDLELWLAGLYPGLAGRRMVAAAPPGGQHMFTTLGADAWLRSAGSLADLLVRGGDAAARAEDVLRDRHLTPESSWTEESILLALLTLVYAGRLTVAGEWCDRLAEETPDGRSTPKAVAAAVRAEVSLRQGALPAAAASARAALEILPVRSWGTAAGLPLSTLVLACTRMGDYDEAARWLALSVPEALYASRYGLHFLHARGHYHLATNHHHAALADFRSCGELTRSWGLDVAGVVPWRPSAAEAWLRLGNQDQARLLIFDQLGRPGLDTTRGSALRLLASISAPGRRPELLGEAVDLFESAGDRFEQARVLADLSRAHNALGQKRRARLLLRRALHVAEMCGATPLSKQLLAVSDDAAESVAPIVDATGIDALTGSERRVASLAVMGYTNREIAAKLFVTASTVEQHLTRVYRKLNIKRRRDLPPDLWGELTKTG
jgi:DNA-binding CsgD family transcriptional regulator